MNQIWAFFPSLDDYKRSTREVGAEDVAFVQQ